MTIDFKWALPFVFPLLFWAMVSFMLWASGVETTNPEKATVVLFSSILGIVIGCAFTLLLAVDESKALKVWFGK